MASLTVRDTMRVFCGFLAAALAAIVQACPADGVAQSPQAGGTLAFSVTVGDPPNYDCHGSTALSVLHRIAPHYSTLVKVSQTRYPEVVPDLAQAWTVSPDLRTLSFRLTPGVRFHDGTMLTAADVRATYERIVRPPPGVVSVRQQLYQDIAAVDTPDDLTVVFRLAKPNATMLTLLASPWNCIYSARRLAQDSRFPERNVVGTGPFRFVRHVAGSEWLGERFEGYFRSGRPFLDGFKVVNIAQPAAVTAISGGLLHTDFRGLTLQERERIVAVRGTGVTAGEGPQPAYMALTFNVERPPFNDLRVRRALNLAIDRWGGVAGLSRIFAYSDVGGMMRAGTPFARPAADLQRLPGFSSDIAVSRAEARRLLAEAGQAGLRLTLSSRREYLPLGIYLIDQWRQIGVEAQQELLETSPYFAVLGSGNFAAAIDGTIDYVDEPTLQFQSFLSFDGNPNNRTRVVDRTVDDLYERQLRTSDPQLRRRLVGELEAHLIEAAYRVPLFWGIRYMAMAADVRGYDINNPSNLVGQDLADIWLARR